MSTISDIKSRMKVINDTRRITGAMETVSIAKMSKALEKYENNRSYFEKLRAVVSDMILRSSSWTHPYFNPKKKGKSIYIVVASDKGLVGSFNHTLLDFALSSIGNKKDAAIIAIGDTVRDFFEDRGFTVDSSFGDISFAPTIEDSVELAEHLFDKYDSENVSEIRIVYTSCSDEGRNVPTTIKLLPLVKEEVCVEKELSAAKEQHLSELFYEPSADEVLDFLIPQYLSGMIYGCLLQSMAAEHSARRAAMNEATRNADELLAELKIEYNRARQSAVTSEITDIVTAVTGVEYEKNAR